MRDRAGAIIYVGKAINLRNRVRSYFHRTSGQGSFKIRELVLHIAQLETIVTESELEALILECNLIKKHRPKYNVRLKDDKNYPYIKIDVASPWPRVYITRRVTKDGARYFGPYGSARSIRATLDVLKKMFPYRSCDKEITGQERRPCLDYHIHRCLGPCIGAASREDYAQVIQQVVLFLEGKSDQVAEWVHQRMAAAAEALDFERAAICRDQLAAIARSSSGRRSSPPPPATRTSSPSPATTARPASRSSSSAAASSSAASTSCCKAPRQRGQGGHGQLPAAVLRQRPLRAAEIVLQIEAEEMGIIQSWLSRSAAVVTITVPHGARRRNW